MRKITRFLGKFVSFRRVGGLKDRQKVQFPSGHKSSRGKNEQCDTDVGLQCLYWVRAPEIKGSASTATTGARHARKLLQRTQTGLMLKVLSKAKSERAGEYETRQPPLDLRQ